MSSTLEDLFLANLHLLLPDVPEPQRQVKLIEGRKFACDFYWPTHTHLIDVSEPGSPKFYELQIWPLVVEVDGIAYQAGGGKHMSPADYEKINLLNLQGYCVLRYLGSQLRHDPYSVMQQVGQALGVKVRELDT